MSATNASMLSNFWASQNTLFGPQGTELWEPNIYIRVSFFKKAVYNSFMFQRFTSCKVLDYVRLYSHQYSVFFFRYVPTEIVIFIKVCYQMKCFSGDSFPYLGAGFINIPPTFLISSEVQTSYSKTLKYSELYIQDQLSGIKVII